MSKEPERGLFEFEEPSLQGGTLRVSGLSKRYANGFSTKQAFQGVNASFPVPGVTIVYGPNGSGKTSLLRCLAGIARATSGTVCFQRGGANSVPRCYYVAEGGRGFHASLSPADNISWARRIDGRVGSLDVVEHLPSIRELLIQKRPAHVLSRGQKQLLAIAMAFLQSPDVYLLDEPTNGLDPLAEAQVVELIQVATQGGAGVVIATHNLALQSIADRIIFMKRGRIVATRNAAAQSVVRCDLEVQPSAVSAALGIGFSRVDAGSMLTASGSPAEVAALICGLEPRDVLSLRVVDRAIASLYLDPE